MGGVVGAYMYRAFDDPCTHRSPSLSVLFGFVCAHPWPPLFFVRPSIMHVLFTVSRNPMRRLQGCKTLPNLVLGVSSTRIPSHLVLCFASRFALAQYVVAFCSAFKLFCLPAFPTLSTYLPQLLPFYFMSCHSDSSPPDCVKFPVESAPSVDFISFFLCL